MLTCTLQDDGVLGKKRTVPLQQADLVMLAFKFTMDDLQIIAVRVTKPSGKYIVEKISIKRTNIWMQQLYFYFSKSYLLGRPSRDRQWIFWFLVGWHTEVMSLRLNTNSQTYSSLVISDTHRHISSKPRELYIPTKYLVFQTPAWKIWFIFKDL